MYHEAAALARELDSSWNYRSKELMTLYAKAKQYEAGEKVEFGGKQFAPLYTPRNDTLINLFQITEDEQRALRTLISKVARIAAANKIVSSNPVHSSLKKIFGPFSI